MSVPLADEIGELRAMVLRVLRGEVTEHDNPGFFDDDIFWMSVRRLEQLDRDWLMAILRDRSYHRDHRGCVAIQMTNDGHKELIVELFAERAPN